MTTTKEYRIKDFVDKDLKVFSNLDNVRSIPSLIDGLKDSQRKAVFGLLKHGNEKIKVSQLGAYAGMVTHYNHGEVSMCDTIVSLAQDFAGSNNVNLFDPIGQFGSIMSSSSSAHRYIYTKPSANLRKYILKEDDLILTHREEEGDILEPLNYFPVLPMWILNGSKGIGTGHSSTILSRNPRSVRDLVAKLIKGVAVQQKTIDAAMTPYFEGWKGRIEKRDDDNTRWDLFGLIEKVNTTTLRVTELPVTYDQDKFKSILIDLMDEGKVKDFDNDSSEKGFNFTINVPREIGKKEIPELINIFKLKVGVGENVTLWNAEGNIKKYANVYEALLEFVDFRTNKYIPRKAAILNQYEEEIFWLRNKLAFIRAWNEQIDQPHKLPKAKLKTALFDNGIQEEFHDRLLSLQISSLTMEKIEELEKQKEKFEDLHQELSAKSTVDLYSTDLDRII